VVRSFYVADRNVPAAANSYPGPMQVRPIAEDELERLLPMIGAYQSFYGSPDTPIERNREFFRRFLAPGEEGLLLGAWDGGRLLGYACLYWHHSSTRALDTVLMNDLYVEETERGRGVGRALIDAGLAIARERRSPHLEWTTRPDNAAAQRLYDSTGAGKSTWIEYELPV
jgi:ribosomal protein S18 acetylase RimI-like enzyme